MIKEAIGFGATIDEAKDNAIKNLGVSEFDDVQVEIIAIPKKKVLGLFGGAEAQVKAFIEVPDKKPNKKNQKVKDKKQKPIKNSVESTEKVEIKEQPKETEKSTKFADFGEPVSEEQLEENSPAKKAVEYIKTVIKALNCNDIKITVANKENASLILLEGEDISILIGRRGETLEAIQYLASLAANNGGSHYKIALNIGTYRQKREEALVSLSKRIAEQVLSTSKSRTLEPMSPYERRIIHTTIQNIEGVDSKSFGEGSARRIVIFKEGTEAKPARTNTRRGSGRKNNRPRPKTEAVQSPAREPKKDTALPLYGKIN